MAATSDEVRDRVRKRLAELQGGESSGDRSDDEIRAMVRERMAAREAVTQTDQILAQSVGQGGLGPTLDNPNARFRLSAADTFPEKRAALRRIYPEGDLYRVKSPEREFAVQTIALPGEAGRPPPEVIKSVAPQTLLWQESENGPWGRVDSPDFEAVNDVLEFFADDLGTFLGEAISAFSRGGVNVLTRALRMAAGAFAGDQVQQELIEINEEPWDATAARSFTKSVASAVGTTLMDPALLAGQALRRGDSGPAAQGLTGSMSPEAEDAIRSSQAIGLEEAAPLTAGQVTSSPAIQRLESLAEQIISKVKNRKRDQQRFLVGQLDEKANAADRQNFMAFVAKAHGDAKDNVLAEAQRLSRPGVDFDTAGTQMKKAYDTFEQSSKQMVDQAYREARSVQEPQFDTRTLLGSDNAQIRTVALEQLAQIKQTLAQQTPEGVRAKQSFALKDQSEAQAVARILSDIAQLPDVMPPVRTPPEFPGAQTFVVQPVEQLRKLRSDLSYLSIPQQEGLYSPVNRAASIVKSRLDQLLENPSIGNTDAYKKANKLAAGRYETLEDVAIMSLAKTQRPADIMAMATAPSRAGKFRTLNNLRTIAVDPATGADRFDVLQNAWTNDIIKRGRNGESIPDILKDYDEKSLDLLMSKSDQEAFKKVGIELDDLNSGATQKALEKQTTHQAAIHDLMRTDSTREIDQFVNTINAADAPTKRSVRAALFDWARNDMVSMGGKGVREITDTSAEATVKKMKNLGMDRLLTDKDKVFLRHLPLVTNFIKSVSDTGAAISGAQTVQAARNPFTPGGIVAWGHILEAWTTGRLMINPKFRNFIVGQAQRGFDKRTKNTMRFAAAYAASVNADLREEAAALSE